MNKYTEGQVVFLPRLDKGCIYWGVVERYQELPEYNTTLYSIRIGRTSEQVFCLEKDVYERAATAERRLKSLQDKAAKQRKLDEFVENFRNKE